MSLPTLSTFDADLALHLWHGQRLDTYDIARWLNKQKPQPNQYAPAISEAAGYNSLANLRARISPRSAAPRPGRVASLMATESGPGNPSQARP